MARKKTKRGGKRKNRARHNRPLPLQQETEATGGKEYEQPVFETTVEAHVVDTAVQSVLRHGGGGTDQSWATPTFNAESDMKLFNINPEPSPRRSVYPIMSGSLVNGKSRVLQLVHSDQAATLNVSASDISKDVASVIIGDDDEDEINTVFSYIDTVDDTVFCRKGSVCLTLG